MELSALPTIVVKVNISCCGSCHDKLSKLLLKADGVASFDIDKDEGSVTIKGNADPGNLVKKIAKALNKKKTKLLLYEEPKKKSLDKETEEKQVTKQKEPLNITEHRHHDDEEESHSTHGDHGFTLNLLSTHRQNPYFNHFGPRMPNSHYPPPRGPSHHGNVNKEESHTTHGQQRNANFDHFGPPPPNPHYPPPRGPAHHGLTHHYSQEMYHGHPMQHTEPVPYGMAPRHQYNYPYPRGFSGRGPEMPYSPSGYYRERPRQVSSTNNVCDYFSDENASGCAIM